MTSRALNVGLCGVDRWLGIKMGWKRIGSVGNTAGPATMTSRAIGVSRIFFFLARYCLGQVPGGAPFSQRSEQATACTNRMQIRN